MFWRAKKVHFISIKVYSLFDTIFVLDGGTAAIYKKRNTTNISKQKGIPPKGVARKSHTHNMFGQPVSMQEKEKSKCY